MSGILTSSRIRSGWGCCRASSIALAPGAGHRRGKDIVECADHGVQVLGYVVDQQDRGGGATVRRVLSRSFACLVCANEHQVELDDRRFHVEDIDEFGELPNMVSVSVFAIEAPRRF